MPAFCAIAHYMFSALPPASLLARCRGEAARVSLHARPDTRAPDETEFLARCRGEVKHGGWASLQKPARPLVKKTRQEKRYAQQPRGCRAGLLTAASYLSALL